MEQTKQSWRARLIHPNVSVPAGVLGASGIQELIAATAECQRRLAYLIKILAIEEVNLKNLRTASNH